MSETTKVKREFPVGRDEALTALVTGKISIEADVDSDLKAQLDSAVTDLKAEVAVRGGEPANDGTWLGEFRQGYADLNFLMPELVDHLEYRKGPYYAEIGDFGTAGSSEFTYVDTLEQANVTLTAGQDSYQRLFGAQSFEAFAGTITAAAAITG